MVSVVEVSVLDGSVLDVSGWWKGRRREEGRSGCSPKNKKTHYNVRKTQCFVQILTFKWHPWRTKTQLSWDASVKLEKLKLWKWRFRAKLLSNSTSSRCENEAFVRCFRQIRNVEDVKTKLSCETSFKIQKLKMWAHVFNAAVPMHKVFHHMQNTIAQHHQRWTISSTAGAFPGRAGDARTRRAREPTFHRTRSSV